MYTSWFVVVSVSSKERDRPVLDLSLCAIAALREPTQTFVA